MLRIDIDYKEISSFAYRLTGINDLTIKTQVCLKGIWRCRKFDNKVTMTFIIISINSNIILFQNYQRYVHHITIKNIPIIVFVISFICSIKKRYNPVIVTANDLRVLEIIYSTISRLIKWFFKFWIPGTSFFSQV